MQQCLHFLNEYVWKSSFFLSLIAFKLNNKHTGMFFFALKRLEDLVPSRLTARQCIDHELELCPNGLGRTHTAMHGKANLSVWASHSAQPFIYWCSKMSFLCSCVKNGFCGIHCSLSGRPCFHSFLVYWNNAALCQRSRVFFVFLFFL